MAFVFGVPVVALVCVCLFGSGPLIRLVLRRLAYMVLGLVGAFGGILVLVAIGSGNPGASGQAIAIGVSLVIGCTISIAAIAGVFNSKTS